MALRPHAISEYQRLEAQAHRRERALFTIALMAAWALIVLIYTALRG
jgi:hypothetical protein